MRIIILRQLVEINILDLISHRKGFATSDCNEPRK